MDGNDNHINEVQIGKACSMHGNDEKYIYISLSLYGYLKIPIKFVMGYVIWPFCFWFYLLLQNLLYLSP